MEKSYYKHAFKTPKRLLTSLSVYNTGMEQCTAGQTWGPGVRDHYLIHYLLSGRGSYTVGDVTYPLEAGSMFLACPGATIMYQADKIEPYAYCWVGFNGPDAEMLLAQTRFSKTCPVLCPSDGAQVQQAIQAIYRCHGSRDDQAVAMVGALYSFLSLLMEESLHTPQETQDAGQERTRQALDYISNNFATPLSIEEVAAHVGVSRSMLYRLFMTYVKMSPVQYLSAYRIRRACTLLTTTQLPIKAVAFSVGFEDPLYFSRRFKEITGSNPSEYVVSGVKEKIKKEVE